MAIIVTGDSGKCNTKGCAYNTDKSEQFPFGRLMEYKRRTRMSPGDFRDDDFSSGSLIAKIDNSDVFLLGRDALKDPEHVTSKMQDIHRNCVLTAIARNLGEGVHNGVKAFISMPFNDHKNIEKRLAFKQFIFGPDGTEHSIILKDAPETVPFSVRFTLDSVKIYPEGAGVIYEYPLRFSSGINGAIDIGQQNINYIYVNNGLIDYERSFTTNQGFTLLMADLMNRISRGISSEIDENVILNSIAGVNASRMLPTWNKEEAARSRDIINECLWDYVEIIRQEMLSKGWPLGYMRFTLIGGVPNIIRPELQSIFGDEEDSLRPIPEKRLLIPKDSDMINARGMLHMAASRDIENIGYSLEKVLPLPESVAEN